MKAPMNFRFGLMVLWTALVVTGPTAGAAPAVDSPSLQLFERAKATYVERVYKNTVVIFEDGEQVPLRIVSPPPGASVVGPLASEYAALERAANEGSAEVAFALHHALQRCQHVAPSDTEFCEGVTAEQLRMVDAWLVRAAALGHGVAAATYAEKLGNTPDAIASLETAWKAGVGEALATLAQLYRQGRSTPPVRAPDPVRAYAYQYLYTRLLNDGSPPQVGPLYSKYIAAANAELREMEKGLREGERAAAMAQAKALLKDNRHCCLP